MQFTERLELKKYGASFDGAFLLFELSTAKDNLDRMSKRQKQIKGIEEATDKGQNDKVVKITEEMVEDNIAYVKKFFVSGKLPSGDEMVDAKKDDIDKFPPKVILEAIEVINGEVGK